MDSLEDQDFTMRDDVILFSDALSHSGHNIKNYRKKHQEHKRTERPIPVSTEYTQNNNNFIWTIENSDRALDTESNDKMKLNLDKLSLKRMSVTAGNSRKKNIEHIKTQVRTIHVGGNARQNAHTQKNRSFQRQNKFKSIEKQFNKGPLREKYLECWLNSLLLEACHDEKFDMTTDNSALKKFQLDRNSLLSKGIKVQNLTRLYKSLFVYSVGFNDLLNQICNNSMNLRKSIWKVYAILLEYCAEGSFEMMIAEIERDKVKKIEGLRGQIEKRQRIIENNEEINEEKNAKIYKQIKYLKDENERLINEKAVLMEEYKQAEQAFNQEVSLRLKFENRINQIHGVYTEIKIKHDRLVFDHDKNWHELVELRSLSEEQKKTMILLKSDNQKKTQQLWKCEKQLKYSKELVGELEVKKNNESGIVINLNNKINDLQNIIAEKNRELEQKDKNYQNIDLLFESEKREHEEKSKQFLTSIDENSRLHKTIQDQMKELNSLYIEVKNFGFKTSEIKANMIIAQRRQSQAEDKLKETENKLFQQEKETLSEKTNYLKEKRHRQQLETDLQLCYEQIKDMRKAKNSIEESLERNMKKIELIDEIIDGKDKEIEEKTNIIAELRERNSENINVIKNYQSKIQLLTERIENEHESHEKKFNALKEEKAKIDELYGEYDSIKKSITLELEKYKQLYEDTHTNLKNQLFEKNNLDIMYKQSLNVMEHENTHIRDLNIEKSQLNEEIFSLNRKLKNIQYFNEEKEKQFAKDKRFWESEISHFQISHKEKRQFIHPMVFEDVVGNYANARQSYEELKKKYETEVSKLKKEVSEKHKQLQITKMSHEKQNHETQLKYETLLEKKNNQILYEKERREYFMGKNKELEENYSKYETGKIRISSEDQEKYLARLNEKKKQIDELVSELEKAHDQNTKMKKTYLHLQDTLPKKDQEIRAYQDKLQSVSKQLSEELQEKEEIKKELESITQKFFENENGGKKKETTNSQEREKRRVPSGKMENGRASHDRKYDTINWKSKRDRSLEASINEDKRGDFAKKYKAAYNYYQK